MVKKISVLILSVLLLANLYGCVALLAGVAGGVGTATWLSGKLSQEVNASFKQSIKAAKSALKSLRFELTKETKKENIAQMMGKYSDGRTIWIDIHRVSELTSRIAVRVGALADKEAARKILERIIKYL